MSDNIQQPRSGLGRILRHDKGSRTLLIFGGVAIVAALVYALFLGSTAPVAETSRTRAAPTAIGNPATNVPPPPSIVHTLSQADTQRAQLAQQQGSSSTPTPVIADQGGKLPTSLVDGGNEQAPERPVPRTIPVVPVPVLQPVQQVRPNAVYGNQQVPVVQPVDPSLLQAMLKQMEQLNPKTPNGISTVYFNNTGNAGASGQSGAGGAEGRGGQTTTASAAAPQQYASSVQSRFLTPAPGTILYSRLVGRVNSDTPGPVIGEILQGPFSGARLLGTFQFSEQGVVINFSSMTVPYKDDDGAEKSELVPIHAVAVDASHLGTAMATDIDRHILERVGVAFGTAFLQGLGQAVAQSGSTATYGVGGTTVSNATLSTREQLLVGGGAAAGAAGQVFSQAFGNRRTTITVEADTPFGLLFLNNNAAN
jgi:intracellular multiplication protein IcmE